MSVVKINAIEVPEGAGEELEARFAVRAGAVEGQPGFQYFQLLRPTEGESRYFVMTWWDSEDSFQAWMSSRDFAAGHGGGGRPDSAASDSATDDSAGSDSAASDAAGSVSAAGDAAADDSAGSDGDGGAGGAQPGSRPPVSTGATLMSFEVVEQTGPAAG